MKYKEKIDSTLMDTAISLRYQGVSITEIERELNLDRRYLPEWVRECDPAKAQLERSLARARRAGDSPPVPAIVNLLTRAAAGNPRQEEK